MPQHHVAHIRFIQILRKLGLQPPTFSKPFLASYPPLVSPGTNVNFATPKSWSLPLSQPARNPFNFNRFYSRGLCVQSAPSTFLCLADTYPQSSEAASRPRTLDQPLTQLQSTSVTQAEQDVPWQTACSPHTAFPSAGDP